MMDEYINRCPCGMPLPEGRPDYDYCDECREIEIDDYRWWDYFLEWIMQKALIVVLVILTLIALLKGCS